MGFLDYNPHPRQFAKKDGNQPPKLLYTHTHSSVCTQYTRPYRKKPTIWVTGSNYILPAFWLFSFNEFCAVHCYPKKRTWKRICCWLITCARIQKGTRLKIKRIYPFKEENSPLKTFYPNVQHCYYKLEIMYIFEHWVHAYVCVSVCNVNWICQHHR